jgi:YD repeat-containing protein
VYRSTLGVFKASAAGATATEVFEHNARDRLALRRRRDGPTTRFRYDSFNMLESIEHDDGPGARS